MDGLLILRNVSVENANAITGLTWGFPGLPNFLGFVHALSRKLQPKYGLRLDGCGVISHDQQVHAHKMGKSREHSFALTRNPLTKEGKTASFNEEGRMHMKVSLLVPLYGAVQEIDDRELEAFLRQHVLASRLAGGSVTALESIEIHWPPEDYEKASKFERKQLRKLLPGFALVQRSELLHTHTEKLLKDVSGAEPLDAWLDFFALKQRANKVESENQEKRKVPWQYLPKPAGGWIVPVMIGYRGISNLYNPGEVARARDREVPFRFVESVYSVGEWVSPHRINKLEQVLWRYSYQPEGGWYLCSNRYRN